MNEAQQQLADQSARNLADEAAAAHPIPLQVEVEDGRFAYAAYGAPTGAGDTTRDGRPMPTWDQLGDRQRAGYIAIGRAFAARRGQIGGVTAVRVRVTKVNGQWVTVEPVAGEHFIGEGPIETDTAFLAVRLAGGRNAVVRFSQPPAAQLGATADAILITS